MKFKRWRQSKQTIFQEEKPNHELTKKQTKMKLYICKRKEEKLNPNGEFIESK